YTAGAPISVLHLLQRATMEPTAGAVRSEDPTLPKEWRPCRYPLSRSSNRTAP
ncbi:hypothetical protein ACLOJK_024058, partial [Asimina triloba]